MAEIPSVPTPPYSTNYAYECRRQSSYAMLLKTDDTPNTKSSSQRTWPRLRDCLRQYRLQFVSLILGCLTHYKSDIEHRKVAIHHSRRIATWHSIIHLVPLGGAITLLILQWTEYWIGTQTKVSTFLQFAAKIHELTMQASIVEVMLCVIRTMMVDGHVPLGALSAATQPTQMSYLWSLEFASIFTSPVLRGWRKAVLICAILLLIALTSLVGPSSAILMIPRPDTPHVIREATLYSPKSAQNLYPSLLREADGLLL